MTKWHKIIIAKIENLKLIHTERGYYGIESWSFTFYTLVLLLDIYICQNKTKEK